MIRIGVLGDIGSGKSYVAKNDKKIFLKLKKNLPKFVHTFPLDKSQITDAILTSDHNLKKIIKIIHKEITKKMNVFLKKNVNKKIIVLDIPLLLENKLNHKKDILVFVHSKKSDILKKLKKRDNFNKKLYRKFKNIQLPLDYKKKQSNFIIKNKFTKKSVKSAVTKILNKINNVERNSS